MSRRSFLVLLNMIRPLLPTSEVRFVREPISPEAALSCVLWRLAHGHSSRSMANLFGMGESTIRKYVVIICRILSSTDFFHRVGIRVPHGDRLEQIMAGFEAISGLPHIARALDGTHIRLQRKPAREFYPTQYINRHGFPSILLQVPDVAGLDDDSESED
ncbi:hypothetical protein GOP47_0030015 [Adiantum capillus-veneris]|nr:hypothetical protein GOP47_0030015 [Adiantum capillus-veneris]